MRKGEKEKEKDKEEEKGNVKLVRADLVDFWALVYRDKYWQIHSNYLLYPNPYPKSQHLKRRWHGHPVFPILLGLGGNLIVRSNWNIYCEEFLDAVKTAAFNPTSSIKESLEGVVGMIFPWSYNCECIVIVIVIVIVYVMFMIQVRMNQ